MAATLTWMRYRLSVRSGSDANVAISLERSIEWIHRACGAISFAFRLFGNIFAGSVLILIFTFLLPFFVPNNVALAGETLHFQGLAFDASLVLQIVVKQRHLLQPLLVHFARGAQTQVLQHAVAGEVERGLGQLGGGNVRGSFYRNSTG